MVRQFLASHGDPSIAAETAGKEALVIRAERDRSLKSGTFDFLEPTGRWTTPAAALDAFLARRADTLDFVRSTVLPLHHHGAPLGSFGLLSTHQWLLLMAEHTGRHIAQIREAAGEAR